MPDDHQGLRRTRGACSEAPKGLYIKAQGKRSATLGRRANTSQTLKGLHKGLGTGFALFETSE